MVVIIRINNVEGLWNVFSGENHINFPGLHCTWFTSDKFNVGFDEK